MLVVLQSDDGTLITKRGPVSDDDNDGDSSGKSKYEFLRAFASLRSLRLEEGVYSNLWATSTTVLHSQAVAQHQFLGVRVEVVLLQDVFVRMATEVMFQQGNRHDERHNSVDIPHLLTQQTATDSNPDFR